MGTLLTTTDFTSGRSITLEGSGTFNPQGIFTATGIISGSGDLTLAGSGTLSLQGINTYTGTTTINGGTLSISSDSNLGDPAALVSINGGTLLTTTDFGSGRNITLDVSGGTFNPEGTFTTVGIISGSGDLILTGSGMLLLQGTNTYTGTTTINAGIL